MSFFYGAEEAGEKLSYELYLDGVKVGEENISSVNGLSYSNSQPGFYNFDLDCFTGDVHVFDEVKFSGAPQTDFLDASDFLVEYHHWYHCGGLVTRLLENSYWGLGMGFVWMTTLTIIY